MGTNNKQAILEGRKWDVIESVDGFFFRGKEWSDHTRRDNERII